MKRILSLFLTLVLAIGIFSVVPVGAETYTEVDCPQLSSCDELDKMVNEGSAKGIFIENMEQDTKSEVYKLTLAKDSYVFMQYGGVTTQCITESVKDVYGNLSIYSDVNLTKAVVNRSFQKEKQANYYYQKFAAGTYYVQLGRTHASLKTIANVYAYFGYLPLDTKFFSVDFVKSENGGKNVTLKLNTLDTLSKLVINDSNGPGGDSFWTISVVGQECKVDKDGYFTIGINQNDSGYCYFKIGVKDVYGNEFSNWYGIMTDYTTVVKGVPNTVEYTSKPISLKDLDVVTGYSYSNCATYDVKYENNTNVGTAKVTITGNGNFIGSVTKTFKIVHTKHKNIEKVTKKPTYFTKGTKTVTCLLCGKISSSDVAQLKLKTPKFSLTGAKKQFKVKYTKAKDATGFEVKYKLGKGKFKVVKVTTKKSMTKVIKKLKKGSYKVQVRAVIKSGKKTAYSNWSSLKTVTVK